MLYKELTTLPNTCIIAIVGNKECLEIKEIKLRQLNILGSKEEFNNIVNIKVRSTGRLLKAKINSLMILLSENRLF